MKVFRLVICFVAAQLALNASLAAQSTTQTEMKFPWEGEVSGERVNVRSGPGTRYYPTSRLNTGDRVLVLAEKSGWYEIDALKESFCFIDKTRIDKPAGVNRGVVTADGVEVRAGSHVQPKSKSVTLLTLSKNDVVNILGEADGFYKIVPPPGANLYVSRDYIRPVAADMQSNLLQRYQARARSLPAEPRRLRTADPVTAETKTASAGRAAQPAAANAPTPGANATRTAGERRTPIPAGQAQPAAAEDSPLEVASALPGSDDQPVEDASADGSPLEGGPTSAELDAREEAVADELKAPVDIQPAPTAKDRKASPATGRYQTLLTVLESELKETLRLPNDQRDFSTLKPRLQEIADQTDEYVPSEIAKIRIRQIDALDGIRLARAEFQSEREELDAFRDKLTRDRMALARQSSEQKLEKFNLEGELMRSHAFGPQTRRYRLVDPVTVRTIAYVDIPASVSKDIDRLIGRRVGIYTTKEDFSHDIGGAVAVASAVVDLTETGGLPPSPAQDLLLEPQPATAEANPGDQQPGRLAGQAEGDDDGDGKPDHE